MRHCAWCGDPGDEHGSHGICPAHAAELEAQLAARRLAREAAQVTQTMIDDQHLQAEAAGTVSVSA